MNIKLRESNFIKALKKGGALVLTLSMFSNFTGCTIVENPETSQSITESTIVSNGEITPEVENELLDFQFLDQKADAPETATYDWIDTMRKLREKEENIYDLFKPIKNNWRYGIAMYADIDGEMANYCRIVDNDGNFIGEKIPFNRILVESLDNRRLLITLSLNYGVGTSNDYIIFDHATGKAINISATNLKRCGDYICKTSYENEDYCYQLLYRNGNLASNDKYSNIVIDDETGYIYLSKNDEEGQRTQILNPETGKYLEIEGLTVDAYNNYIIFRNYKNGYNYAGVYHLENINKPLVKKVDNNYNGIQFIKYDEIPMIVCNKDGKLTLATAEGNVVSAQYDNIKKELDYFIAYDVYDTSSEKKHVISLIDEKGTKIIEKAEVQEIKCIPGTNAIIYREQGLRGNYGIMDFDKNIIIEPEYEFMDIYNNRTNPEKFAIYGHKNVDGYINTYVFDNNFKEITHGSMHEIIVYEIVDNYYKVRTSSKQKTIGTNHN